MKTAKNLTYILQHDIMGKMGQIKVTESAKPSFIYGVQIDFDNPVKEVRDLSVRAILKKG
jgi:hypothetical protein